MKQKKRQTTRTWMVKGYEVIHEYVKISSYSLVSIEIKIETTLFFMQNFQENWKLWWLKMMVIVQNNINW